MFALGKLPAHYTLRTMRSAIALSGVLDALGTPPSASNNYLAGVASIPCNMYGNDRWGDCVEADTGHMLTVRTANASTQTVIADVDDVLRLYRVFGFDPANDTDPGTAIVPMCQYLKDTGFLGHKLDNFGSVDPANIDHLKWCIQLFGSCRMGWQLPNYVELQFANNRPWDFISGADQTIRGGHDTPLVYYEGDTFYTTSWGRWNQPVTIAFINNFCDEAHAELAYDWIREQGLSPSGFDLTDLEQKMAEATA